MPAATPALSPTAWSAAFPPGTQPTTPPGGPLPLDGAELGRHRGALVRFAERRLHDPVLAEDVVHDVFEAVLSGRAVYCGRAALRTWLIGVLKHKIVDLIRQRPLHEPLATAEDDEAAPAAPACPQAGPQEQAEHRQQLRLALARIAALPAPLKEALTLRVLEEQETAEVCSRLRISEANLFVRLHRARRQLWR